MCLWNRGLILDVTPIRYLHYENHLDILEKYADQKLPRFKVLRQFMITSEGRLLKHHSDRAAICILEKERDQRTEQKVYTI